MREHAAIDERMIVLDEAPEDIDVRNVGRNGQCPGGAPTETLFQARVGKRDPNQSVGDIVHGV
jgi:hypothetical protein